MGKLWGRLPSKTTIDLTVPGIKQQNKQELNEYLRWLEQKDYATDPPTPISLPFKKFL